MPNNPTMSPRKLGTNFSKLHKQLFELERHCLAAAPDSSDTEISRNLKRDVVTRALLALRQATAEQRIEIVRQFGSEALQTALAAMQEATQNAPNGAADTEHPARLL